MKIAILAFLMMTATTAAFAETDTFDNDKVGIPPADWACGVTGRGTPKWMIEADSSAPSKPNVIKQSGRGTFPWCVKKSVSIADGFVEVKFKPLEGRADQAGGLVWRWKDGDNYYVARANALEDNISLYYTEKGNRITIKYVDAPVPRNQWHTLRVEFTGKNIKVLLDGKSYIELEDNHIAGAGAVGVWTKADSVTAFDDFSFGAN
ncbi:MAG: family 16 glycoside hydrolase [Burkholderiales bacterium]